MWCAVQFRSVDDLCANVCDGYGAPAREHGYSWHRGAELLGSSLARALLGVGAKLPRHAFP